MQEKKRNKYAGIAIILIVAVIVILGISLAHKNQEDEKSNNGFVTNSSEKQSETMSPGKFEEVTQIETTTDTTEAVGETATAAAANVPIEEYEYAYAGFSPALANMNIDEWNLLLVNRDYILPEDYAATLSEAVKGSGVNLDSRVSPHYQMMYDAAKKDGVTLTPLSGNRRISTQKRNFENKIQTYMSQGYDKAEATELAAQIILPPGTSEHNAGLAMDICSLDVSFENTKEFAWLCENAADFGFILRYPKNKTDITKITYEPWHWRYVGVGHAKAIKERGICLEEYLRVA